MTNPSATAVTPRGHRPRSKAALPLAQLLLPVIHGKVNGIVIITAPAGGGKTTALQHLRRIVPADAIVGFFDADQASEACTESASRLVVLATAGDPPDANLLDVFSLAPWTLDDCMEYLVARHRPRCKSVLDRLSCDTTFSELGGSPQLLSLVMDAMAADESLQTSRGVLRDHLQNIIPPGLARDRLIIDGPSFAPLNTQQWRWWRHESVQQICVADWIAESLCIGHLPHQLRTMETAGDLITAVAAEVRQQPAAREFLERSVNVDRTSAAVAVAASILLAADPDWRPIVARGLNLSGAKLAGAQWSGVDLTGALLIGANLTGADSSGADLGVANLDRADLTGANLRSARLGKARFVGAILDCADLEDVSAPNSNFSDASLESANLRRANFRESSFRGTNLNNIQALGTDFSEAGFSPAHLYSAVFDGAKLIGTRMFKVDMSEASWNGVCFARARVLCCNLEWLEIMNADFDDADLSESLLTGTRIHGGRFRGTNLTRTGLAEVDWTDADLNGADLTGASFHMGSTRSGLVGSTIAGEGSRTGFYTDDSKDQWYKPPEEIRKACLCGTNLLGAKVERTDFYLVDLRRAVYSEGQAEHFQKSGAILEDR